MQLFAPLFCSCYSLWSIRSSIYHKDRAPSPSVGLGHCMMSRDHMGVGWLAAWMPVFTQEPYWCTVSSKQKGTNPKRTPAQTVGPSAVLIELPLPQQADTVGRQVDRLAHAGLVGAGDWALLLTPGSLSIAGQAFSVEAIRDVVKHPQPVLGALREPRCQGLSRDGGMEGWSIGDRVCWGIWGGFGRYATLGAQLFPYPPCGMKDNRHKWGKQWYGKREGKMSVRVWMCCGSMYCSVTKMTIIISLL